MMKAYNITSQSWMKQSLLIWRGIKRLISRYSTRLLTWYSWIHY